MLDVPSLLVISWATAQLTVTTVALARRRLRDARPPLLRHTTSSAEREVLVVRPVSGGDAWLLAALSTLPAAPPSHRVRLRIAIADEADEAYPIASIAVTRLVAQGHDARLVLTHAQGQNRKAAQLAAVLANEPAPASPEAEIVVIADADVDLQASPLTELLAGFDDVDVGATWAPPIERAPAETLADRGSQALLGASLHAFPLLACLDEGGMVGKLCAVRRSALDRVGGFASLVPWLGEDMRLANALRASGTRIEATSAPAISVITGRSTDAVVARYARWIQVIRAQRPGLLATYPLLFFGTFPTVVLLSLLATRGAVWAVGLAAALLLARLLVARTASRAAGRFPSRLVSLGECLLADGLLAWAWLTALSSREVAWKQNRFTFDRRGMLQEATEARRVVA